MQDILTCQTGRHFLKDNHKQAITILWHSLCKDKVAAVLADNNSGLGTEIFDPGRRTNKDHL